MSNLDPEEVVIRETNAQEEEEAQKRKRRQAFLSSFKEAEDPHAGLDSTDERFFKKMVF
jgi:hypothetical protein